MNLISPLLSGGIVGWEKAGAGQRLVARNVATLHHFLSEQFPKTQSEVAAEARRIQGVARFRDTKALRGIEEEIVCVRGWRDGVLLRNGKAVPLVEATQQYGLFAFLLTPNSPFTLHGQIATVENPIAFTNFERLDTSLSLALYARGCMSRRLRAWLAIQAVNGLKLVHFGDYDPPGLNEYLQLRATFGEHARLYIPPNLSELFRKYSKRQLLRQRRSQTLLQSLRNSEEVSVRAIVELIDENNAGLEQEALLVDHPTL